MNQQKQLKNMSIRIANIKFSLVRKRPKAYHSRQMSEFTAQPSELTTQPKENNTSTNPHSPSPTHHSSLIPHTNIRTTLRKSIETRKINYSNLKYPNCSYSSMFPYRKPKSMNSFYTLIPIYKQKFRVKTEASTRHDRLYDYRKKRTGSSCLDMKTDEEKNGFVRYSSNSLKTQYVCRKERSFEDKIQSGDRMSM